MDTKMDIDIDVEAKNFSRMKGILIIMIFIAGLALISYFVFRDKIGEYIDNHYGELRCNPLIMPLMGLSKKADGKNTAEKVKNNYNLCMAEITQPVIASEVKPHLDMMKSMTNVTQGLSEKVNGLRAMGGWLRQTFQDAVHGTRNRIEGLKTSIHLQTENIKTQMKKQAALFAIVMEFMNAMRITYQSFTKGPIPKIVNFVVLYLGLFIFFVAICFICASGIPFVSWVACPICILCFEENTLVDLHDERLIKIGEVMTGDTLKGGSKVYGTLKVYVENIDLYSIKNSQKRDIKISGDHLIFEDGKWIRTKDAKCSMLINKKYTGNIVCLMTSDNRIRIADKEFKDYQEIGQEKEKEQIKHAVDIKKRYECFLNKTSYYSYMDKYNNNNNNNKNNNKNQKEFNIENGYYWGVDETTHLMTHNGLEEISKIQIGDTIWNNDREIWDEVRGIIKIDKKNVRMVKLVKNGFELNVSGTQFIFEDGKWKEARYSKYCIIKDFIKNNEYDRNSKLHIYSLITRSGEITVGEYILRDFMDTHDEEFNKYIDQHLMNLSNTL